MAEQFWGANGHEGTISLLRLEDMPVAEEIRDRLDTIDKNLGRLTSIMDGVVGVDGLLTRVRILESEVIKVKTEASKHIDTWTAFKVGSALALITALATAVVTKLIH